MYVTVDQNVSGKVFLYLFSPFGRPTPGAVSARLQDFTRHEKVNKIYRSSAETTLQHEIAIDMFLSKVVCSYICWKMFERRFSQACKAAKLGTTVCMWKWSLVVFHTGLLVL